uniref:phage tail sheath family protein n=1 Tax=Paractinoplanes polyasparticus TaxID=2856853 RepID=UPI001C857695|nr:phage tail sheath C-terminal domain-containing protein [Actinoplanes polyasparticus]
MPEYLAPGVYTEEIATGPVPIEGVSTSTAGMAGLTDRGPETVRLITSAREFTRWFGNPVGPDVSYLSYAVQGFFDNGGRRLFVTRVTRSDAVLSSLVLPGEGAGLALIAIGPGNLNNRLFARVIEASRRDAADPTRADSTRFRLQLVVYAAAQQTVDPFATPDPTRPRPPDPDLVEDFDDLSADPASPDYVLTALQNSCLVAATVAPGRPARGGWTAFDGGADGVAPLTLAEFRGAETPPRGIDGLGQIDEISLLCMPDEVNGAIDGGVRDGIRTALVTQCEELRDRFAVLQVDGRQGDASRISPPLTTSYAAIYYPWLRVLDPSGTDTLLVPPGGHITGIYAGTDIARGVHKAPANVDIRGIVLRDLPGDRKPLEFIVNKRQQDILNPRGINVCRDFRGDRRGIRVWGARTLSADAQWKYVNVRRLFIFVEESVDEGVQWVVFEPNNEATWDRVRRSIANFLTSVWRSGALMGTRPEEAFFVRCDRTTMSQQEIDTGQLVCYIGLAAVRPAEFVILRYSHKTSETVA